MKMLMKIYYKISDLRFFLVSWDGVRLSPLATAATVWPTVPAPDGDARLGLEPGQPRLTA
jgi:hypothetical protein